jgi:hypothetical protein
VLSLFRRSDVPTCVAIFDGTFDRIVCATARDPDTHVSPAGVGLAAIYWLSLQRNYLRQWPDQPASRALLALHSATEQYACRWRQIYPEPLNADGSKPS